MEQYQWAGFAIFSVVYLAATAGSLVFDPLKYSFGTTVALNYVRSQVADDSSASLAHLLQRRAQVALQIRAPTIKPGSQTALELKADLAALDENIRLYAIDSKARWRAWLPGAANTNAFRCVGHCLFALLWGLLGSAVGKMFYARRERSQHVRAEMP
jgi:hypothetical protein